MAETAETSTNDLLVIDNQELSIEQLCKEVGAMNEGAAISSDYWTIDPGKKERIVFIGMTTMAKMNSDSGERIPAIKLLLVSDGTLRVNGDSVLASTCKDLKPNTPLSVECTGKASSGKGKYKEFVVKLLK